MRKTIVAIIVALLLPVTVLACTNFIVGKNVSADGSTMISYAADSYGMFGFLHYSPATDYPEGAMREVKDWDTGRPQGFIPQVAHTYTVVGNMNENQVAIGETTWGGREALWDTVGIDYGSLIYIALERSKTAREAIEWFITLVNEYGYASEGESFSFGDPNEVWIMDLIGKGPGEKGANWVAVRIPDDAISAHANQARITTLPQGKAKLTKEQKKLQKKLNCVCHGDWMWDKDLITFAREKGYFSGADKDFSFQAAYNPFDFSGLYVCEARVWSFFRHFSNEMDHYFDYATGKTFRESKGQDAGEHMPLWITPNRKVSVQDMKECMRDEYKGTALDITQGTDAGPWNSKLRYGGLGFKCAVNGTDTLQYWYERPTATQQTAWSFVAQMRSGKKGIFWFDDKFNTQIEGVDAQAAALNEEDAKSFLTSYSCSQAENLVADWQRLYIYLITKFIDGQERKEENGQFTRNKYGNSCGPNRLPLPENFLKMVAPEITHE